LICSSTFPVASSLAPRSRKRTLSAAQAAICRRETIFERYAARPK
jgi:hypothetical protein